MSQVFLSTREISDAFNNYSKVIQLNQLNQEGKKKIENTTESILLRLDEYGEHLDSINQNKNHNLNELTPQLLILSKNLKLLYQKIDAIDEYVNFVGNRVIDLEKKVTEIEKQDSTSIFSFFGSKPKNKPIEFIPSKYYLNPGILISKIEEINKKKEFVPKKESITKVEESTQQTIIQPNESPINKQIIQKLDENMNQKDENKEEEKDIFVEEKESIGDEVPQIVQGVENEGEETEEESDED
eukprot:gene4232-7569_t